jgi:hypothetical protein
MQGACQRLTGSLFLYGPGGQVGLVTSHARSNPQESKANLVGLGPLGPPGHAQPFWVVTLG